jgi:TolB protein
MRTWGCKRQDGYAVEGAGAGDGCGVECRCRSLKFTLLKLALSGGAFAVVIACVSGCSDRFRPSMLNLTGRSTEPELPPPPPVRLAQTNTDREEPAEIEADHEQDMDIPATDAPATDVARVRARSRWTMQDAMNAVDSAESPARPPQVNVFGEFDGHLRPAVMNLPEAGYQQHTVLDEGYDADVAVDPAGKWLVFSSTRHSDPGDLYMQRVDGTSVIQLTSDVGEEASPVFSPDGQTIAFCSTRGGDWDLYTMDREGRNVTQVTSGPAQDLHPSFSPDGKRLVYCSIGGRSGQWELWTVNLLTQERRMIGFGLFPNWSPDKTADRIAYQRARQRGSRWFSLWTLHLVDGEARQITEVAVSTNAAIVAPAWSPDGKRLTFGTIAEPARTVDGKPLGQQDIWAIDADGTNRQRLTDGNGMNLTPFWAADNRVYFISDRGGHDAVWSVRAQGGTPSVAGKDGQANDPFASTDQRELSH